MRFVRPGLVLVAVALVAGCGGDRPLRDGGSVDGSVRDGSRPDGSGRDAGSVDGAAGDASVPDASVTDAGPAVCDDGLTIAPHHLDAAFCVVDRTVLTAPSADMEAPEALVARGGLAYLLARSRSDRNQFRVYRAAFGAGGAPVEEWAIDAARADAVETTGLSRSASGELAMVYADNATFEGEVVWRRAAVEMRVPTLFGSDVAFDGDALYAAANDAFALASSGLIRLDGAGGGDVALSDIGSIAGTIAWGDDVLVIGPNFAPGGDRAMAFTRAEVEAALAGGTPLGASAGDEVARTTATHLVVPVDFFGGALVLHETHRSMPETQFSLRPLTVAGSSVAGGATALVARYDRGVASLGQPSADGDVLAFVTYPAEAWAELVRVRRR